MGRWSLVFGLAMVGVTIGVRAVEAQSAEYQPHGFISTRYDTHTSSNIYIGYQLGPVTPMVALVSNPRTTYREHLVGVVRFQTFSPRLGLTYAVAASKAIDSWYGQIYALPSVAMGRLKYDATFELYVPLQSQGVHQLAMNPGNLMFDVNKHLAVGGVGVWESQTGAPYAVGAGPSVKLRIPKGSITLDGVLGVTRWTSEWRISFFTAY
jgi:hypothetical protein